MNAELSTLLLSALIFVAALLYSSVGHGGASGYIAVMALAGIAPEVMKPTALMLNVLVASIATYKFYRAGAFSWRLFWPLAITAVPMAYLGGALVLPGHFYKPLVGLVLLYAAWRSIITPSQHADSPLATPHTALLLTLGAGLGLLSGLTGVGGGIFLSPILLLYRWAHLRVISGVAAAFILVNSCAGLLGLFSSQGLSLPSSLPYWALAAVLGGWLGAEFGSRRLANPMLRKLLALVLAIAGAKMLGTAFS